MKDLKISLKMTVFGAVLVSAIMLCVGLALWQVRSMAYDGTVVNCAGIVRGGTQRLVKLELAGRPADPLIAKLDGLVEGLIGGSAKLGLPAAADGPFKSKMGEVRRDWASLRGLIVEARTKPDLRGQVLEQSERYFELTNGAVAAAEAEAKGKVGTFQVVLSLLCLGMVAVVLLAWRFSHSHLARPLAILADALRRIAAGDLTVDVPVRSGDEIGVLAEATNAIGANFRGLLSQANTASIELASMAEELSATTASLAESNEAVSGQTHETAVAAEEMSATVDEVARNTASVSEAADEARRVASDGVGVISEAVGALGEITAAVEQSFATVTALGEKSEKIGAVIEVIQEIADQTNLLALNAAIEAARAGEHGRGFAVVADEVRKLAEKTVRATQEIGQTIVSIQEESQRAAGVMEAGQEKAVRGRELGERAGHAVEAIGERISEASEQTHCIASATNQLSATIREVATNMDTLARGAKGYASAVGEIAGTAREVALKAEELKTTTGRFTT